MGGIKKSLILSTMTLPSNVKQPAVDLKTSGVTQAVAPEAVWQVGRPPYQSEIWYGGSIPIRDAGISLVLIPKTRYSITFFILLLYQLLLLIDILIQHTYPLTDLVLRIYCYTGSGANSM